MCPFVPESNVGKRVVLQVSRHQWVVAAAAGLAGLKVHYQCDLPRISLGLLPQQVTLDSAASVLTGEEQQVAEAL